LWWEPSEPEAGFAAGLTARASSSWEADLTACCGGGQLRPPMEACGGFRPGRPIRVPCLGPVRIEGLWLARPTTATVCLLAAVTAELITPKVSGDQARMDQASQPTQRFARRNAGPLLATSASTLRCSGASR